MTHGPVHVLLVHYDTPDLLGECIRALLVSRGVEVHVVDNASPRPGAWSQVQLAWADEPRVHLVRSTFNRGFGGGVNLLAEGLADELDSILWVLNPDTLPEAGALERLVAVLRADMLDVVSPVLTTGPSDSRTVWFAGGHVTRLGRVVHHQQGAAVDSVRRPMIRRGNFVTGAAPMMSVRTWIDVGPFREELFLYWEDVDWCLRAVARGMRLGVAGEAEVWHAVGRASADTGKTPAYYYYNVRNRVLLLGGGTLMSRSLFAAVSLLETARVVVRALRQPSRRVAGSTMALRGLVHGVRGLTGPA